MIIDKLDYINEVKEMFNDICILYDMELVRIVGFCDGPDDYYYIYKTLTPVIDFDGNLENFRYDRVLRYGTFVGHCVSLKGIYPRYQELDNTFEINGCTKEPEFILEDDNVTEQEQSDSIDS